MLESPRQFAPRSNTKQVTYGRWHDPVLTVGLAIGLLLVGVYLVCNYIKGTPVRVKDCVAILGGCVGILLGIKFAYLFVRHGVKAASHSLDIFCIVVGMFALVWVSVQFVASALRPALSGFF